MQASDVFKHGGPTNRDLWGKEQQRYKQAMMSCIIANNIALVATLSIHVLSVTEQNADDCVVSLPPKYA